jgi:hypothetical protein
LRACDVLWLASKDARPHSAATTSTALLRASQIERIASSSTFMRWRVKGQHLAGSIGREVMRPHDAAELLAINLIQWVEPDTTPEPIRPRRSTL